MSTNEIEKLSEKLYDLGIKVLVLEKLYDQSLSALAKASVAEKTADKALAMAQEALVIVMKPASEPSFPEDIAAGYADMPLPSTHKGTINLRANGPSDDDLTKKLEEAENEFS